MFTELGVESLRLAIIWGTVPQQINSGTGKWMGCLKRLQMDGNVKKIDKGRLAVKIIVAHD